MSTTNTTLDNYRRMVSASHFNRNLFDDSIKPNLFNLLSHRANAAKELLNPENSEERYKELIEYYNYIDSQIIILLTLPVSDKPI